MERLGEFTDLEKEYVHHLHRDINREGIVWKFPNGYGASVACNEITHNVPELAVLKFDEVGESELVYDTPITSDVVSHLTLGETKVLLERIKKLDGGNHG